MRARTKNHWKDMVALTGLLVMVLSAPFAFGQSKKNKNIKAGTNPAQQPRLVFDIRELVWPNPPAVARVKYVNMLTGEKIDWGAINPKTGKKKRSWMDRLAGSDPDALAGSGVKVPYQLIRPYGIAVDAEGRIYTADQGVDAIFIFDAQKQSVELIRNGYEAHFGLMNGLAVDDNDRLFVSDMKLRQILVFDAKHKFEMGFGNDVLGRPGGIAIDRENRFLYVVDTDKDIVDVFDADSFKLLRHIGTPGKKHTLTEPGTFSLPSSVALDKEGNVYVTDTLNNRVEIFDPDGNFISMFGKNNDGPAGFTRPKGIAVDSDKNVWVMDTYQDRLKVFDQEGRLLAYIGGHGNYPGQFMAGFGVAIDAHDRVITSEQWPGRLQVFQYVTNAEAEKAKREQSPSEKAAPSGQNGTANKKDSAAQ